MRKFSLHNFGRILHVNEEQHSPTFDVSFPLIFDHSLTCTAQKNLMAYVVLEFKLPSDLM